MAGGKVEGLYESVYMVLVEEVLLTCFVTLARLLNLSGLCLYQKKVDRDALRTLSASWLNRSLNDAHCPVPDPQPPLTPPRSPQIHRPLPSYVTLGKLFNLFVTYLYKRTHNRIE